MRILINGQWQEHRDGISMADLLSAMSIDPRRVAVELNKDILPRAKFLQAQLSDGDALEIVTLVGGG